MKIYDKIRYTDNFIKILDFYLINCPINGASERGKKLDKMGWVSNKVRMLENRMKSASGIDDDNWIFDDIDKPDNGSSFLRCYSTISHKTTSKAGSIIYSIRCALAHGNFTITNDNHYYFENIHNGKTIAKISVSEEVLLKWIKLVNTKPEKLIKKNNVKKHKTNAIAANSDVQRNNDMQV